MFSESLQNETGKGEKEALTTVIGTENIGGAHINADKRYYPGCLNGEQLLDVFFIWATCKQCQLDNVYLFGNDT